jgi:hypothetical protein
LVEVSTSIFTQKINFLKKKFEKKKISLETFEIEIFQLFLVPMGSGVSGMDTSNN